jgi:hypothetical protein
MEHSSWRASTWTALALAVLAVCSHGPNIFNGHMNPQDEALLLVYPDLILRGYMPYRDFAALYPPGNFYLLAALYHILGESLLVERCIALAYQYLIVLALFLIGSRMSWLTGFAAAVAGLVVLGQLPFFNFAASTYVSYATALFALFCASKGSEGGANRPWKRWILLAGLLSGATYWFRHDVGVLGTVAALLALHPKSRDRLRLFAIGLAPPALGMIAFAIVCGATYVFDSLILDVIRTIPGRTLPIELGPEFVLTVACVIAAIAVVLVVRKPGPDVPASLIWFARAIAILSIGLALFSLRRASARYLLYVGVPVLGLTIVLLRIFLTRMSWRVTVPARALAVCVLAGVPILAGMHARSVLNARCEARLKIRSADRWVYTCSTARLSDANGLIREITALSRPGEKLFVGPHDLRFVILNDTFFYYLLPQLEPATRYLEMNPGSANRSDSGLAPQVAQADWLILTSRFDGRLEPNTSSIPGSPAPNQVISRHFCLYSKHGIWQLFRRCVSRGRDEIAYDSVSTSSFDRKSRGALHRGGMGSLSPAHQSRAG